MRERGEEEGKSEIRRKRKSERGIWRKEKAGRFKGKCEKTSIGQLKQD